MIGRWAWTIRQTILLKRFFEFVQLVPKATIEESRVVEGELISKCLPHEICLAYTAPSINGNKLRFVSG